MSTKWNSAIMFPTDSGYSARIVGCEFSPSKSSDNPMITFNWEVVSPGEVEVAGDLVNIAGVKAKSYTTITSFDNGEVDLEKTAACRKRATELLEKLKYPMETIDWDNLDTKPLLGLVALVQMSSQIQERRKTPTKEQIEIAKKSGKRPEGDIMKHPVTGRNLVDYWPKIDEVFGLAPEGHVKMAY